MYGTQWSTSTYQSEQNIQRGRVMTVFITAFPDMTHLQQLYQWPVESA